MSETAAPIAEQVATQPSVTPQVEQAVSSETRPAWLPEKFKTPEDFVASYKQLESKLGGQKANDPAPIQEAPKVEQAPEVAPEQPTAAAEDQAAHNALTAAGLDPNKYNEALSTTGSLSDEHYAELEAKGFTRDMVDTYVDGLKARQHSETEFVSEVHALAGGAEGYAKVSQWAAASLPQADLEAFNAVVARNNKAEIRLAVSGLVAQYRSKVGYEPAKPVTATAPADSTGAFTNVAEVKAAINDPRYHKDAAYRRSVEQRLARSKVF